MSKSKSQDSTNEKKPDAAALWGFGLMFLFGFGLMLLVWGLYEVYHSPYYSFTALLWILAFVVAVVSVVIGAFFIIRSKWSGDRQSQAINNEIAVLANDASFDISEQIIVWDRFLLTKGLETQLEGREDEITQVHRRLVNAHQEIAAAESPQHRLESVMAADAVLATARSLQ